MRIHVNVIHESMERHRRVTVFGVLVTHRSRTGAAHTITISGAARRRSTAMRFQRFTAGKRARAGRRTGGGRDESLGEHQFISRQRQDAVYSSEGRKMEKFMVMAPQTRRARRRNPSKQGEAPVKNLFLGWRIPDRTCAEWISRGTGISG